jgi:hypothetical protein
MITRSIETIVSRVFVLGVFVACSSAPSTPAITSDDAGVAPREDAATGDASVADGSAPSSSKGTGGLTCTSNGDLGGGRTFCLASISGSELKLALPRAAAGPLRVVAYLHGDGAGAYNSNSAMRAMLPFADAHNALVISVLAPNRCAWWQVASQTDCSGSASPVPDTEGANADVLRDVFETLRARYDVRLGASHYFYGSSGGSIFLTLSFMRKYGNQYPGVYALNCGGEAPTKPFAWDVADEAQRGGSRLFFTYGDQDFLKPQIERAIPFFRDRGFATDVKLIAGATHCAFDGHGRAAEIFEAAFVP